MKPRKIIKTRKKHMKPTKKTRKNRMKGGMVRPRPHVVPYRAEADPTENNQPSKKQKQAQPIIERGAAEEDQQDNCNPSCKEEIAEAVVQKLKESHDVKVVVNPPDEQSELEKMQSLVRDPTSFKRDHEYSELFLKYLKAYMLENYGRFNIIDLNRPPSPLEPEVIIRELEVQDPRENWHKFFELYSTGDNQQIKEYLDMVDRYEDLYLDVYTPPYLSKADLQERIDQKTEENKIIDKIMRMVNNLQYLEIHYIITKEKLNPRLLNPRLLNTIELILQTMTKIELVFSSNTYVSSNVMVSKEDNIQIVLLIKVYLYCAYLLKNYTTQSIANADSLNQFLLSLKTHLNKPRFNPMATGVELEIEYKDPGYKTTFDAIFQNPDTPSKIIKALKLAMNQLILSDAIEAWDVVIEAWEANRSAAAAEDPARMGNDPSNTPPPGTP